jgi:hypothetical protein
MAALDASEARRLEAIGYDLSTAKSRAEIHADHVFVRDMRKGAGRAKMAALGAITVAMLALVGHWIVSGIVASLQATLHSTGKAP